MSTAQFAKEALLTLAFQGPWISGSGVGGGRLADIVTHRDAESLPAMPMTQVKGTLRETATVLAKAKAAGWDEQMVACIFGGVSEESFPAMPAAVAFAGEARMTAEDGKLVGGRPDIIKRLFVHFASTKINEAGVASDRTLRKVEAAQPVTLVARIRWIASDLPPYDWIKQLDAAAAATFALGALKNDGFGRVVISCLAATSYRRNP